jgi:dTDP-glucose pyrophosphorylase/predicted transcriptional regulator
MKNLSKLTVSPGTRLRDALSIIDEGGSQIALVIDEKSVLIGVITDGDIRRGILRGLDLDMSVRQVMSKNFLALRQGVPSDEILTTMRSRGLRQIPIVNEIGVLKDLVTLVDFLSEHKSQSAFVLLMAGGEGKRLGSLTKHVPKPMLPINGKPILEIIIERLRLCGFRKFFISVNYLKDKIKEHFEYGKRFGVEINYLEESEKLGTGGALCLLPKNISSPCILVNADVLTSLNFPALLDFHRAGCADITVCVREVQTQIPFGVVDIMDGHVKDIVEKPAQVNHVSAGVYVLNSNIIKDLGGVVSRFDMPDLIQKCLKENKKILAFPVGEYWADVGLPDSLVKARSEWNPDSYE